MNEATVKITKKIGLVKLVTLAQTSPDRTLYCQQLFHMCRRGRDRDHYPAGG